MRVASLLVLLSAAASPAFAQNDYLAGLINVLGQLRLNRLVSVAQLISNTTTGQALFADLPNGNKTLFAPTDQAFSGTPPSNITDPNQLADILSYHIAIGSFYTFAPAPNHTILRTELNSTQLVSLEGNKSQVLALSTENNVTSVVQQNTPVTLDPNATTTYQNLVIHIVGAVIDLPPPLSLAVASNNLSVFAATAQLAGLVQPLESAHGLTVFAPNNPAFASANQSIGNNLTLLQTLLSNHVINGTSAYSTELSSGNYTSAGGEPFTFGTNDSGTFVTSGPSTARIVQTDILVSNGVMHVIDNVLFNTQNNTQAANEAFASATSVAAQPTTETSGVGVTGSTGSSSSPSSVGGSSGAVALDLPFLQWSIGLVLALAGCVLVL